MKIVLVFLFVVTLGGERQVVWGTSKDDVATCNVAAQEGAQRIVGSGKVLDAHAWCVEHELKTAV